MNLRLKLKISKSRQDNGEKVCSSSFQSSVTKMVICIFNLKKKKINELFFIFLTIPRKTLVLLILFINTTIFSQIICS